MTVFWLGCTGAHWPAGRGFTAIACGWVVHRAHLTCNHADAFAGAFTADMWADRALPLVHCYAFLHDTETEADLRKVSAHPAALAFFRVLRLSVVQHSSPNPRLVDP